MKIVIEGLWHLGLVTAAGLVKLNHNVICYSSNSEEINNLNKLKLPIFEKSLINTFRQGLMSKKLKFTSDKSCLSDAKIYWYCADVPVKKNDIGDSNLIFESICKRIKDLKSCKELIISSQIKIGTIARIEKEIQKKLLKINVSYLPENLRLGMALKRFLKPDRIIAGCRSNKSYKIINKIFQKIKTKIIKVKPESAEIIKHSINAFLANSVCFINEISKISNYYNSDNHEISVGLKSDERIGKKSYLSPGEAYAGGTLGRDVRVLEKISKKNKLKNFILENINKSNLETKNYLKNTINKKFLGLNKKILILGLAYTQNTSSLRNSEAIKLAIWLKKKKFKFKMHDPLIKNKLLVQDIPKNLLANISNNLKNDMLSANVIIVMTNNKYYMKLGENLRYMKKKTIYLHDPFKVLKDFKNFRYF